MKIEPDKNQEVQFDSDKVGTVNVGSNSIIIDKLFGPTAFAELRITANVERNAWVIERGDMCGNFREWCTIPGQQEEDYREEAK